MANSFETSEAGSLNVNPTGQPIAFDYMKEGQHQDYSRPDTAQQFLGALQVSELKEVSDTIFALVDEDNNGVLSPQELGRSVENDSFHGQEAQAVAAIYQNMDILQAYNTYFEDGSSLPEYGITRDDMTRFDMAVERESALTEASSWSSDHLLTFDQDGNQRLSAFEIDKVLEDQNLPQQDRQVLTYLKDNIAEVVDRNDDHEWFFQTKEISTEDFNQHIAIAQSQTNDTERVIEESNRVIERTEQSQTPDISRDLFADKESPEKSVTPESIRQGTIEDHEFLASLAALASTQPELIVDMIKDNGDGTYTVSFPVSYYNRFPGGTHAPVTVNAPTDAELGLYNAGSSDGTWATVLEKAYGKYLRDTYLGGYSRGVYTHTDADAAERGRGSDVALALLTGEWFGRTSLSAMSQEELAEALEANFSATPQRPITASTPGIDSSDGGLSLRTVDGFPRNQCYTILGFNPDGNNGGTIVVRNPLGDGQNNTNGTIEISLEQFQKNFESIVYQRL